MKHTLQITIILTLLFLTAQIIGLFIVKGYITTTQVTQGNITVTQTTYKDLPYQIERPQFEEKTAYLPIFGIILGATFLLLLIMKLGLFRLWKFWFFISVWFCLLLAFAAFLPQLIALIGSLLFALWKVLKPNVIVHNFTELFIYAGLSAMFIPILNILSISILLILIAIYDAIAVWKTKHMVDLAKMQSKAKMFAGILIPYKKKVAMLGGGDIGFPLLFAAVVMKSFPIKAFLIPFVTAASLLILLIASQKNKFYPAMPFLAAGCFLGYLIVLLL